MTALSLNSSPPAVRRAAKPAIALLLAALGIWWLFTLDRVEQRVRDEEVEMFDLAVPPPPPPPPPPEPMEQQQQQVEEVTPTVQAIQRDPLSPPQPTTANPPAGDLSSLLQDPTADSGSFVGGARGQGGTGSGPMIGGVGRGGQGNTASRAYAELVQRALIRHLRRRPNLASAQFDFRVSVRVGGDGRLEILGLSNVRPADLESELGQALRSLSRIDTPPPAGVPNQITLQLNQA